MRQEIIKEDSLLTLKKVEGVNQKLILTIKANGEFIFGENAHPQEAIEIILEALPQGVMKVAERQLSADQLLSLLATKLGKQDKMLAVVEVEVSKIEKNRLWIKEGGTFIPKQSALIIYGGGDE